MGCGASKPEPEEGADAQVKKNQNLETKFQAIADKYETLDQVQQALREGGLESSQLIVGVDFTKSNQWQGERTFGGQNLHAVGVIPNQYELAISTIGRTLDPFDDDKLIPVYGFGDLTTSDADVFTFFNNERPARGFEEVLARYRELAPKVVMSGPTSFAPLIRQAMVDVSRTGGKFHILLILADGQVSDGIPEERTIQAITEASNYPLSIVCIGVGDGPWDDMENFDDKLDRGRKFDNFQFVPLSRLLNAHNNQIGPRFEAAFALRTLIEIPQQYQLIKQLHLLSSTRHKVAPKPCPPPIPEAGAPPSPVYTGPGYTASYPSTPTAAAAPPAVVAPPPPSFVAPPPGAGASGGYSPAGGGAAGGVAYPTVSGI